jgi:hypothetical protein
LFDVPDGSSFKSVIQLYKAASNQGPDLESAYGDPTLILDSFHPQRIVLADLVDVPAYVPANEAATNASSTDSAPSNGDLADSADRANATQEFVVATWQASATEWNRTSHDPTGASDAPGWIDAAWTTPNLEDRWQRLAPQHRIGPCSAASNAVAWRGSLYVACVVQNGYAARSNARIGDLDLWRLDPADGSTSLVGFTGIRGGGRPLLSLEANADGDLIGLLSYTKVRSKDGHVERLRTAGGFGWMEAVTSGTPFSLYGSTLGPQFRSMGGGADVAAFDADITAFQLVGMEGAALVVYKEWHDQPQNPQIDPLNPDPLTPIGNQLLDYNKYFVAFDTCNGILAAYHIELGRGVDAYNAQQYTYNAGTFNGIQDGLVLAGDEARPLVYFSIDDYGSMQYGAAVVDAAASSACVLVPPVPALAPALVPQALSQTSANVVGAMLGIAGLSMVTYLLTVKRRRASFLAAESR